MPHLSAFLGYLAQERRVSPRSIEAYRYCIRTYLAHLRTISIEPSQVTRDHVLAYLNSS